MPKYAGERVDASPSSRTLEDSSHHSTDILAASADLDVGITVVSGGFGKGHALLRLRYRGSSGLKSSYFHVRNLGKAVPRFIDGKHAFDRYLQEQGKTLIGTFWFERKPAAAHQLITELNSYRNGRTFLWCGTHHNCWSFAIQVAKDAGFLTPSFGALAFKSPQHFLERLAEDPQGGRMSRLSRSSDD